MAAVCEALGVRFEYPENWSLDDENSSDDAGAVVVSGPETAMWHLARYPADSDLEELFDEALATFRAEYRDIEVAPASETVEMHDLAGYDINFFYLDLTVTIWLRAFRAAGGVFLLICQAEDSELERVGPVFHAMLVSLFRAEATPC